jgi:hypothetical protein
MTPLWRRTRRQSAGTAGTPREPRQRRMPGALVLVAALGIGVSPPGPLPVADAATRAWSTAEGMDPCAMAPRAFFRDVGDGATAASAIDCLLWHDLVRGVTHERFEPSAPLTRAQVATLIDRMVTEVSGDRLPAPAVARFTDVGGVHAAAIERLAAADIVAGRSADRYEPEAPVRRDQLASLLSRTYRYVAGTDGEPVGEPTGPTHGFSDLEGNVHEARIAEATRLGLVGGTTATTYDPSRSATRAQTAMMLARLLQRSVGDMAISATVAPPDGYASRIAPLPPSLLTQVERWTWEPGCPVPPGDLRLLELVHIDLAGTDRWGLLIVHRNVATDVAGAFGALYDRGFPIARMEPIERFRGDDDASMAANNTSGFNCRRVTGGTRFSEHAYGWAIDINPIQNPYVRGSTVLPAAGRAYTDRGNVRPGMLVRPGSVAAFDAVRWGWGGDYESLKDYQHLSLTGR